MSRDPELLHVWSSIQRAGGAVVSVRYSERDHLAVAMVRDRDGRLVHSSGYDPIRALARCLELISRGGMV